MLTLTRKTDYALIALTHLAQDQGGCSSAREIATRYQMPLPLLMNVLKLLTQRGLAQSVRGPRGGYSLAAPPQEIALSDIIQAVEGPIQLTRCASYRDEPGSPPAKDPCDRFSRCPVRSSIHRVHSRLVKFLSEVTLADVADNTASPSTSERPSDREG